MQEPLAIYFTYRIIGIDGTIKVYELPHETSKWSIKFIQPGVVGAAVIGTFEIVCPPPASNEAMLAQDDLDKITEQMRVEAYLGDKVAGDPLLTGIIRQRPTKMNGFVLKGSDITVLAQTALTGRNEQFKGTTDALVTQSLKAYKLKLRDKFNDFSQWSNPGVWTTDTNNGPVGVGLSLPAAKHTASSTGDGLLLSNTSFTYADYGDAYVDALYTLECGTTPGNQAEGCVVMGATDTSNLILGRALMTCISATNFRIDADIFKKSAGAYGASKKSIKKVINGIKKDQLVKVTMTSKGTGQSSYSELVTADDPISWWHCNEASGDLVDSTLRANTLTAHQFGSDLTYHQTSGIVGDSYAVANHHDGQIALWGGGIDGGVIAEETDVSALANSTFSFFDDFTMEAWVYPFSMSVYGTENSHDHVGIIMRNGGHGDTHQWGMCVGNLKNEIGTLGNWYVINSSAFDDTVSTTTLWNTGYHFPTMNVWYHLVAVRVGGVWHAFVNGSEVGTTSGHTPLLGEREGFSIGGDGGANAYNFDGRIDEVAIYDEPLTSGQIASHYQLGATGPNTEYRLILNGRDSGCSWIDTAAPSGSVGLRSTVGTVWAANFVFPSKVNMFNAGNIAPGVLGINQIFSSTPMLDRWNIAAVTEGVAWRVIRHPFIDSLDWGPAVGDDKTASVHLRAGDLQADSSIEPNTDPPATAIRVSAGAGQDNAGFIEWIDLDAADKYGLVYDPMSAQNVSDTTAQIMLAKEFAHLRGTPGVAKILHYTRTIDNAEKFTIGDYIKATDPELNIFNETVQVMGLDYEEGKADMVATCDQYPSSWSVTDMRRVRQELDALANGTANLSPSSSGGIVYDAKTGSPFILSVWSGYEAIDTTHKMRIRFEIPANLGVLQKVIVNFSGLPFRAGLQSTAAANTSGASSASSSGASSTSTTIGQGNDHFHNITLSDAGAAYDVTVAIISGSMGAFHHADAGAGALEVGTDTASADHTHGMDHTHTIAHTHTIPSLTLNNPTGLHETGMARNVHLYVDDGVGGFTDVSSALGGPWDGGGSEFDVSEIDITPYLTGGGFHEIQLSTTSPSTVGGIKAAIYVFGILQSI